MAAAGMGWLYFALMGLMAMFLGAFGSVFNTYSSLYLAKDNDLLLSLPIPVRIIMASRLVSGVPDGPDVLRRGDAPGRHRVLDAASPTALQPSLGGRSDCWLIVSLFVLAAVLPAGLGGGEDQPEAEEQEHHHRCWCRWCSSACTISFISRRRP